ncbi:MAG: hypothetical protein HGA25_08780 [Clostridiales bacterium]|nr:hypothetical protein [Clostridiales bacterium]
MLHQLFSYSYPKTELPLIPDKFFEAKDEIPTLPADSFLNSYFSEKKQHSIPLYIFSNIPWQAL